MNLQKESLRSLTKHMELIAKTFFEFKKDHKETYELSDVNQYDSKHSQNSFINRVEEAYSGLNPIEQLFINNDFFYEDYPDWWKDLYTKTQYTRYMKRAIVHFLRLFYDDED